MITRLMLLALVAGLISGCSDDSKNPAGPIDSSGLQLAPADGATAVPLDATVTLRFSASMDRAAVESGFHLMSEADTNRWCPDSSMHRESFDHMMRDRDRLQHMDAYHSTPGRFSWDGTGIDCTFRPDSPFQPQTRYMVHMETAMLEAMRERDCRWDGGQTTSWGDRMTHFHTMAESGAGQDPPAR